MKIFDWMQSRFNAKQKANKTISKPPSYLSKHECCKEEFSDWPIGLLAIGTFGNTEENVSPCEDHHQEEITPEEFKGLQKELKLFLHKESSFSSNSNANTTDETKDEISYPSEKFFDCLQNLEDDRNVYELLVSDNSSNKDVHIQGSKGNNGIRKKTLTYLLRRTISGAGRPKLNPMLKDPVPEIKLEKSRLEKILRALLKKKIYPQSPTSKVPTKQFLDKIGSRGSYPDVPARKCLENKYESEKGSDDEEMDKLNEGSKWVKTDSEFIVLEI